jgi:3-deoxy-D-manno-octulosonate 8-phosphate phosphatase (KDO 8-P phosphatase)
MLKNIKIFAFDCDGVLTDNHLYVGKNGEEFLKFTKTDGLYMKILSKRYYICIITNEKSKNAFYRAKKIGIDCFYNISDKEKKIKEILKKKKLNLSQTAFIGNELNDIEILKIVGLPIAVADADIKVKKLSKILLKTKGGFGVVKEIYKLVNKIK